MADKRSFFWSFFLLLLFISTFNDVYGHPMFNSEDKFSAGYRVQVSKTPEFSQIGEPFQFKVRVTDEDSNEINGFTMGIRIFYNDQQIDTLFPKSFEGGHGDFDYIWKNQGNHVVKIDLYNVGEKKETVTFTFNIGTQSPYGYVLLVGITIGVLCVIGISGYVYLPRILKKSKL